MQQGEQINTKLDVGDEIIDFNLDSQLGRISFHDIIDGKWCLLVTFLGAFDPVATSDFGMLSKLFDEFESRNVFIIALGNDSVPHYRQWIRDVEELQTVKIKFAVMSDSNCCILNALGCARQDLLTDELKPASMGAFLIDVDKRIRYSSRSSPLIGRNWYEYLRQFDALMACSMHRIMCPSNWGQGQDVMVHPEATPEDTAHYKYVEIKPWFKITPFPESL